MRHIISFSLILACIFFPSCVTTKNARAILCQATRDGGIITVTITNNLGRDIEIVNSYKKTRDSVYSYVSIRIISPDGQILTQNEVDKEGFWSSLFLRSDFGPLPVETEIFPNGKSIVMQFPLEKILLGLKNQPYINIRETDRIQVKVYLAFDGYHRNSKTFIVNLNGAEQASEKELKKIKRDLQAKLKSPDSIKCYVSRDDDLLSLFITDLHIKEPQPIKPPDAPHDPFPCDVFIKITSPDGRILTQNEQNADDLWVPLYLGSKINARPLKTNIYPKEINIDMTLPYQKMLMESMKKPDLEFNDDDITQLKVILYLDKYGRKSKTFMVERAERP